LRGRRTRYTSAIRDLRFMNAVAQTGINDYSALICIFQW
jgi:hypothetical protein